MSRGVHHDLPFPLVFLPIRGDNRPQTRLGGDMDAWKKRRVVRLAIVATGGLAVGSLMIGVGERASATLTAAQATPLAAMGNLSGTVTSSKPFKAAQVYLRNV